MNVVALLVRAVVGFFAGAILTGVLILAAGLGGVGSGGALHDPALLLGEIAGGAAAVFLRRKPAGASEPSGVHGSARFSGAGEAAAALSAADGLIVGRREAEVRSAYPSRSSEPAPLLRYGGPAHVLTIAPTRSGKGVGAVLPNLLQLHRSVLCIDPKGENARIAVRARRDYGPVHVLDPFAVSGCVSSAFNPLDAIDPGSPDASDAAAALAEALVYDAPGEGGEAHWNEEAKALIAGVLLHVLTAHAADDRSLLAARRRLTGSPGELSALFDDMQASAAAYGLVARAANRHLAKSDREAAGVLSSAQRHTHFLDSPRMAGVLSSSAFRFEALQESPVSVFLVLPPERLDTHARWLRLIVTQALSALAHSAAPAANRTPVLFLLDEFAALGRLQPVLSAFGLMAGYGVQLWAILQDIHQLRAVYGRSAGTFLSNAGVVQIFNVADIDTATWVSRSLGVRTEAFSTTSRSSSKGPMSLLASRSASVSDHLARRDLMTPDEVMRLDPSQMLLLRPGASPVCAKKIAYFKDPEFAGRFDA